jgi:hypothetical protein
VNFEGGCSLSWRGDERDGDLLVAEKIFTHSQTFRSLCDFQLELIHNKRGIAQEVERGEYDGISRTNGVERRLVDFQGTRRGIS